MKTVFLFLLTFSFFFSFGQHQSDNWFFGRHAGLNFLTGNPVVNTGGQTNTFEGVATVSDNNGNLLFYTDGITVWNKLHQIMQNGTGLFANISSTQAAIIVPQPGNDSIYFIFTTDSYENLPTNPKGLNYSTVNMHAAGGLGAIIIKNNLLVNPTSEKLCAVKHCNNRDVWILTRPYNTSSFYAWLLTPSGLNPPVISASPNFIGGPEGYYAQGHLKASSDGKKIASGYTATPYFELGEFSNETGVISNIINVNSYPPFMFPHTGSTSVYGIEFSPDNQIIYTSNWTVPSTFGIASIMQYNISINNAAIIAQSGYIVDTSTQALFYALQIAPDNKIYLPKLSRPFLHVINSPNTQGAGCNFLKDAINLGTDTAMCGLPPLIQVPGLFHECTTVPIILASFRAQCADRKVLLTWQTATELNTKGFELENSIDGIKFNKIGFVNAINNPNGSNYEFIDSPGLEEYIYYRLKSIDFDGKFSYSDIRVIKLEIKGKTIQFYPNPVGDILNIKSYLWEENASINLIDIAGRNIFSLRNPQSLVLRVPMSNLLPGIYLLIIRDNTGVIRRKIFKN